MSKYDLVIVNPIRGKIQEQDEHDMNPYTARGWFRLDMDLDEAKKIFIKVRKYRANGYLVATEYRHPAITQSAARLIALKKYNQLIAEGRKLDVLDEGFDEIMWWSFCAEDKIAIEEGRIPGTVTIAVDKLDGHLRSDEEYRKWIQLSSV